MIIQLHDWKLRVLIGVHPHERKKKQIVCADIDIEYDAGTAAATDRIEEALDYEGLAARMDALVDGTDFYLLETLIQKMTDEIFKDERVMRVQIILHKPLALQGIAHVSLVHEQKR